jgi:Zn-dependent protease
MKNTIKLGKLAGVTVELNWTVLVIAALVTLSVAGGILPAAAPGYETTQYIVGGVTAAVALLASILVHEWGHAIVAQRNGVRVERISLWAFGGVAQLEGEAETPRAEFLIAGIGPAISLVLGLALIYPASVVGGLFGAVLGWLASINIILAVFNLIPGAPLDGGRLLHAWLWKRQGDRARATATATKAGRLVGTALIVLGIIQFAAGGAGGLWTALIGWFLRGAATAEGRYSTIRSELQGVRVRDVMTPAGPPEGDWMSVAAFIDRLAIADQRPVYFLTGFEGTPSRLVTLQALAAVPIDERYTLSVRSIAQELDELPAVQADEPAADLFTKLSSRALTVVWDASVPVGTVNAAQLGTALEQARLLSSLRGETPAAA